MNLKKFLFPVMFTGILLGLIRRVVAKPESSVPITKAGPYVAIEAYLQAQMKRLNIPGASLAIIEGDQIVHQRGFGRARPNGTAPTLQTPFFIGSLTKSITALAVMQLVEAGRIELDAPVQSYLPWFRVADPQASAQMTVRHLLNQTSGIPTLPGGLALADFDERPGAAERQARALSNLKLIHPLGTQCEYSNLNYNLLGLIIEKVSGEPYPDYIQNHIFNPLGMTHSYTTRAAAQQDGLAQGYRLWFGYPFPAPDLPVPVASLASGQLISCAEDMAHYLMMHLHQGRFGGQQLLSSAGMAELHRGVADYTVFNIASGSYAMGWFRLDIGQTEAIYHGGNVPDYASYAAFLPEQDKGVILLCNADPFGLPPILEEVGMGVTYLLAGQQPEPVRLDFVRWVMRSLPLIPLGQLVAAIVGLRMINRWRRQPATRPGAGRAWGQHVLFSLIPNLSIVGSLAYLRASGLLRYLHLFNPDLAWTAQVSGVFAGVWSLVRTGLIVRALRKPA